jgi:hypothetical protein
MEWPLPPGGSLSATTLLLVGLGSATLARHYQRNLFV